MAQDSSLAHGSEEHGLIYFPKIQDYDQGIETSQTDGWTTYMYKHNRDLQSIAR